MLRRLAEEMHGKHVVGVWDTSRASLNLGGMLILVAELSLLHRAAGSTGVSVAFVVSNTMRTTELQARVSAMAEIADCCVPVGRVFVCSNIDDVKSLAEEEHGNLVSAWPPANLLAGYRYESMDLLQEMCEVFRQFPVLEMQGAQLASAQDMLASKAFDRPLIAVHLKSISPLTEGTSNADHVAWWRFFDAVGVRAKFLLVGQDPIPNTISELPNVIVARSLGATSVQQLALVRLSDAFMGMASGPCQMAIFGRKPYAIFKNPQHHREEMIKELRSPRGFGFSLPGQRLIRENETPELLQHCFEELLHGIVRGDEESAS